MGSSFHWLQVFTWGCVSRGTCLLLVARTADELTSYGYAFQLFFGESAFVAAERRGCDLLQPAKQHTHTCWHYSSETVSEMEEYRDVVSKEISMQSENDKRERQRTMVYVTLSAKQLLFNRIRHFANQKQFIL